jgi:multiple sugar transport system ATP-binding protein
MATIELDHVSKVYPNKNLAVSELSLEVADGEFMVLVGPSGCGKTTALRMVAGLEEISGGTIRIGGKVVNELSPKDRDVAMVFQNYALYPHMTVAENIGFSLKLRHMEKAEIDRRVREAGQTLGLETMLNVRPANLSGGQRQRVAMGRALVREPKAFLMDEPLSNLDAKLRVQMRAEVSRIQRRLGVATLYVTHDQIEAMTMGDRVAVLAHGILQQCEPPQILYDQPANLFVAAFIGSPAMNLYQGKVEEADGHLGVRLGQQLIVFPPSLDRVLPELAGYVGREVALGIRPEHLAVGHELPDNPSVLNAEIDLLESLGAEVIVHFRIQADHITPYGAAAEGEDQTLPLEMGHGPDGKNAPGVARSDPRVQLKVGQLVTLVPDTDHLHVFDLETGAAITS